MRLCDEKLEAVARNLLWLEKDGAERRDILSGIMRSMAAAVKAEYVELPTPEEIWEIYLRTAAGRPRAAEFASFAAQLSRIYSSAEAEAGERAELRGTVSFVGNLAAEKAIAALSYLGKLNTVHAPDFRSACEDVYFDRAEYCLLPLESSADGLLFSFRKLAEKYGLRMTAAVKILSGGEYLTLSLLSSEDAGSGSFNEYALPSDAPWSICELEEALTFFDATTERINFIPVPERESGGSSAVRWNYDAHIRIKCGGANSPLKLFIDSAYPTRTCFGSYEIISLEEN